MSKQKHEEPSTGKIVKVLYNQVALVLAILGFGWGIFNYMTAEPHATDLRIQKLELGMSEQAKIMDLLDTIKKNDIHTITVSVDEIKEMEIQLQKDIVEIRTLLQMHMGYKTK